MCTPERLLPVLWMITAVSLYATGSQPLGYLGASDFGDEFDVIAEAQLPAHHTDSNRH